MKTIIPEKPEQAVIQEYRNIHEWEELVSAGIEARESKDNSQWVIGDLAVLVAKNYGTSALEDFSKTIGINKNTVLRYRAVSKVWLPTEREYSLSHRHHMILCSRDDRYEWLEEAASNQWSVEELRLRLKKEELNIPDKVKVGSILFRRDEWERILKWFGLCLDNPNTMSQLDDEDTKIVEKIKNKVVKLISMEKDDYDNTNPQE
jgi:hypothetical protein